MSPSKDSTGGRSRDRGRTTMGVEVRTGVDVQSISAFREFDPEVAEGIKERAFTDDERAYCERTGDPPQHYAVRWAAKEAFVKLLAGERSVSFDGIAVARNSPRPALELSAEARVALDRSFGPGLEGASLDLSLSHDRDADVAVAQIVAIAGGQP